MSINPAQTGESKNSRLQPNGLIFVKPINSDYRTNGQFLYEAAREGTIGVIELRNSWSQLKSGGETVRYQQVLRLSAVDDFEICASAKLPNFGRFQNLVGTLVTEPALFQPPGYFHELAAGRCVLAHSVNDPAAGYVVNYDYSTKSYALSDRTNGTELFDFKNAGAIWAAFRVKRPTVRLWNTEGSQRSPDRMTDSEVIRALKRGGIVQKEVLKGIGERFNTRLVYDKYGGIKRIVNRNRDTSDDIVAAILDTSTLTFDKHYSHQLVIRALMSAGPTLHENRVLSKLFDALDRTVKDLRGPAEKAFVKRVEKSFGKSVLNSPEGKKAYSNIRYLETGADLANELGSKSAKIFATRYKDQLSKNLLRNLAYLPKSEAVVAKSDYAEDLILALLSKVDAEKRMRPVIQTRIQHLIDGIPKHSQEFRNLLSRRCERDGSFFPNGKQKSAKLFCAKIELRLQK